MKIALYGPAFVERSESTIRTLIDYLEDIEVEVYFESAFYDSILNNSPIELKENSFKTFKTLDSGYNLLVSIGGDGTILRAITFVKDLNIPIVGINTGRLGFLATISTDKIIEAMDQILAGDYKISSRSVLTISHDKAEPYFDLDFALNEIVVSRKNTTSMISIETRLDDAYLNSYWADGLIISTPTGSTGYSLSCGGPVIMPESNTLVLTPIAPHNLNARPLVISDSKVITIKVSGRENTHLVSLDSRLQTLNTNTLITIKKAPYCIQMVELHSEGFLNTLRQKLLWGVDKRN